MSVLGWRSFAGVAGVFLLATLGGAWAAHADGRWYGDDRLAVRIDGETGFPAEYRVDGQVVLTATDARQPLEIGENWYSVTNDGFWRIESVRFDTNVLTAVTRAGRWLVTQTLVLHPDKRRVRRAFRLDWTADAPCKLRGLRIDGGRVRLAADGTYALPCVWPTVRVKGAELRPGTRHENYESPYSVLAADGRGHTVTWIVDDTEPDCDVGFTVATESADGVSVTHPFHSAGYVRKGVPQTMGGLWICFGTGADTDAALRELPAWFADVGQHVPADRPDWLFDAVIYSMHPGGTRGSMWSDWGGFGPSAEQLPRIAALGASIVWLLPIEEYMPYQPHDFLSIARALGSRDDYLRFIAKAKGAGLRVFRDIVPHGGMPSSLHFRGREDCLLRDESGRVPEYWCADFANPKWQTLMAEVARQYVADGLSGLRMDACSGSKMPNWSMDIPYARASLAGRPGGLGIQRAIRKGVRMANPDAATLSESDLSFSANVADVLYDWSLAFRLIRPALHQGAAVQVAALRQYLHDEQFGQVPGHLRLRYQENHDSLRGELQYGGAAMEAVQAMLAWMPGVAFVYQEQEDGHTFAFREIYRVRREHPELTRGVPDYIGVAASPGVYAAAFTLSNVTSVVRVNLNGEPADGLAPFGYSLETNGRKVFDSATVAQGSQTAGKRRWCVATADGFYSDVLRVRHPFFDPNRKPWTYHREQGGPCFFDSRLHPFGFTPDCSFVAVEDADGQVWRADVPAGADVRLMETEEPLSCGLAFRRIDRFPERPTLTTGDLRLTAIFGGWRFEENGLRVEMTRGGALRGVWRKDGAERWVRSVGCATPAGRKSFGPKTYDAIWEMEAFVRLSRDERNRLTVRFEGNLRDRTRFGLPTNPLPYEITYVFGGGDGFTMRPSVATVDTPIGHGCLLDFVVEKGDADAPHLSAADFFGNRAEVVEDASVLFRANWIDGSPALFRNHAPSGFTLTLDWPTAK